MRRSRGRRGSLLAASIVLRLISFDPASAGTVRHPASRSNLEAPEPALLRTMIAGGWRLAKVKPTLPPVQVVQDHALEWQHFVDQAFDHGALRLCVSPGKKGGEIFALLVDTRAPRYADFARVVSTDHYAAYRDGPYVVVLPLRPVDPKLFDTLRGRQWTEDELPEEQGKPERRYYAGDVTDYHWLDHRTIVFVNFHVDDSEFYALDALSGARRVIAKVSDPHGVDDFGISGPQRLWYHTVDGERHEVA